MPAPALPLAVQETPALTGFEKTLAEALRLLALSPTAARMAATAAAADYALVIDDSQNILRGHVDQERRLIVLAREQDPKRLALTLGHELTHVSQKINGGLDIDTRRDHPLHAIRKLLAMEADARAHEILIATELAAHMPEMPDIAAAESRNPLVAALLAAVRPRLPGGVAPGKILAACFKAFYGETSFRAQYEKTVLDNLVRYDAATLQAPAHFQETISAAALAGAIDAHDLPYLAASRQHIDLDAPVFRAVSPQTAAVLESLQKIRKQNPALVHEAAWQAPLYADVAAPAAAPRKTKSPAP